MGAFPIIFYAVASAIYKVAGAHNCDDKGLYTPIKQVAHS